LGVEICRVGTSENRLNLNEVLTELYNRKIQVLMVEAGSRVNTSFLKAGLVDKLIMFIAPKLLGDNQLDWNQIAVDNIEQALSLKDIQYCPSGEDIMLSAYPSYKS
jgi:diaminohydroxyphosphoribosylaminopyrimidine deaminase/5-amino-6-(5-phosphoribosylamino)uracil reductase